MDFLITGALDKYNIYLLYLITYEEFKLNY